MAVAAAGVVRLLRALDGQEECDISDPDDLFAEVLINEGGVGEDADFTVRMRVSKTDDVFLADKRLTAGQKVPDQQPSQCILQAEVGSNRMSMGTLQLYFSRFAWTCLEPRRSIS